MGKLLEELCEGPVCGWVSRPITKAERGPPRLRGVLQSLEPSDEPPPLGLDGAVEALFVVSDLGPEAASRLARKSSSVAQLQQVEGGVHCRGDGGAEGGGRGGDEGGAQTEAEAAEKAVHAERARQQRRAARRVRKYRARLRRASAVGNSSEEESDEESESEESEETEEEEEEEEEEPASEPEGWCFVGLCQVYCWGGGPTQRRGTVLSVCVCVCARVRARAFELEESEYKEE